MQILKMFGYDEGTLADDTGQPSSLRKGMAIFVGLVVVMALLTLIIIAVFPFLGKDFAAVAKDVRGYSETIIMYLLMTVGGKSLAKAGESSVVKAAKEKNKNSSQPQVTQTSNASNKDDSKAADKPKAQVSLNTPATTDKPPANLMPSSDASK